MGARTGQSGPEPASPGAGATSGLWAPPETRSRTGPGWRSAHGEERGTAPSLLLHSSLCLHKELQTRNVLGVFGLSCSEQIYTLTSAGRLLAAPHRQGSIETSEQRLPLQVVTHVAVKAGDTSREQVQHGYFPIMRPLR